MIQYHKSFGTCIIDKVHTRASLIGLRQQGHRPVYYWPASSIRTTRAGEEQSPRATLAATPKLPGFGVILVPRALMRSPRAALVGTPKLSGFGVVLVLASTQDKPTNCARGNKEQAPHPKLPRKATRVPPKLYGRMPVDKGRAEGENTETSIKLSSLPTSSSPSTTEHAASKTRTRKT